MTGLAHSRQCVTQAKQHLRRADVCKQQKQLFKHTECGISCSGWRGHGFFLSGSHDNGENG